MGKYTGVWSMLHSTNDYHFHEGIHVLVTTLQNAIQSFTCDSLAILIETCTMIQYYRYSSGHKHTDSCCRCYAVFYCHYYNPPILTIVSTMAIQDLIYEFRHTYSNHCTIITNINESPISYIWYAHQCYNFLNARQCLLC